MKTLNRLSFIILVVLMYYSTEAFSQDWPQWRGINRDGKVTGFKAPAKWPADLSRVWKIGVGTGDATPVLLGSRIYLNTRQGDNEVILCIDASNGKEIWRNEYPSVAVTGPAASHPGPRSTPAIADGKVVTYGAAGVLSCLDANTGRVIWRKANAGNEWPQFFTGMSPLIAENMCFVHTGAKDKGRVTAYDLKSGAEKWSWNGDGPSYSSPSVLNVAGKKQLIVQTEKNLVALDFTTGNLLWQIATPVQQRFYNCVSPYIDNNTIYYSGQGTGTKAIKEEKSGNTVNTKEIWSNNETGAKWNTPVLKDGYLYGFTDQKRIYCLDAATGKTAWTDNAVNSDFASIVDCGSVLIGLPSTGNLIVFKPDHNSYTELARYKVSETPVYTFPVIAGNNIYIKDAESLILYRIQ